MKMYKTRAYFLFLLNLWFCSSSTSFLISRIGISISSFSFTNSVIPTTILSGDMKSLTALPSFKNSGLFAISKLIFLFLVSCKQTESLIIQNNIVLGLEASEGTDELIKRCYNYKKKGDKGILIKLPEKNLLKALNLSNDMIANENFKNNKIIDLRIYNSVILTNE